MRTKSLPLLVLALIACSSDRNTQPDTAPPPKPACTSDDQCVGAWRPDDNGCGSVNRCFGGECVKPPAITGVGNTETAQIEFATDPKLTYQVEMVDEPFETQRGLMCRDAMKDDWGMLFELPTTRVQRFWMKNTLIPLDIVFLDEEWRVVGAVTAQPLTLMGRGVDTPSRYVLELNAGEATKRGLVAGVQARYFPPSAQ